MLGPERNTEMNKTITEIKNTLEGINSRITEAEEWISELEDRMVEISAMEQNKEKFFILFSETSGTILNLVSETSGTILNVPTFQL